MAEAVDCTVVVLVPAMGDMVQTLKAGTMEIGDLYVVNKADRDGAEQTRCEIMAMLALADDGRATPVLLTRADRGEGIVELADTIDRIVDSWAVDGHLDDKRFRNLRRETLRLIARGAQRRIVRPRTISPITAMPCAGGRSTRLRLPSWSSIGACRRRVGGQPVLKPLLGPLQLGHRGVGIVRERDH